MSTTEIKACPFCGQQPVIEKPEPSMQMVFVKCLNHECTGRPGANGLGERMAIDRWNRRAGDRQPAQPETRGAKGVGISDLLGEPHLTLTIEEIRDLAQFCGMVIQQPTASEKEDERDTEIVIAAWPKKGVFDEDQKCQVTPHKHIAYFEEYHEEGVLPLGSPNAKAS